MPCPPAVRADLRGRGRLWEARRDWGPGASLEPEDGGGREKRRTSRRLPGRSEAAASCVRRGGGAEGQGPKDWDGVLGAAEGVSLVPGTAPCTSPSVPSRGRGFCGASPVTSDTVPVCFQ